MPLAFVSATTVLAVPVLTTPSETEKVIGTDGTARPAESVSVAQSAAPSDPSAGSEVGAVPVAQPVEFDIQRSNEYGAVGVPVSVAGEPVRVSVATFRLAGMDVLPSVVTLPVAVEAEFGRTWGFVVPPMVMVPVPVLLAVTGMVIVVVPTVTAPNVTPAAVVATSGVTAVLYDHPLGAVSTMLPMTTSPLADVVRTGAVVHAVYAPEPVVAFVVIAAVAAPFVVVDTAAEAV